MKKLPFIAFLLSFSICNSASAETVFNRTADKFKSPSNLSFCNLSLLADSTYGSYLYRVTLISSSQKDSYQTIEASIPLSSLYQLAITGAISESNDRIAEAINQPEPRAFSAVLVIYLKNRKPEFAQVNIVNAAGGVGFANVRLAKIKVQGTCP